MLFNYRYHGATLVEADPTETRLSFSPDTRRKPTFFSGKLSKAVPFREAMSALHDVVVSDTRFKPRDKSAYKEWAAQQELIQLGELTSHESDVAARIQELSRELKELRRTSLGTMAPFYKARRAYFNYLYEKDRDAWFVLDPVVTVHPDELFFECFSQDESSYGRLGVSYEVFRDVGETSCGTTNVDYSAGLYDEFQKVRSYKTTELTVDPSGFEVETGKDDAVKEVKIDLPDSWVRGFLQVSSAMTLPARTIRFHPMDIHNFCFVLRRRREKTGPRSIRFHLTPGEPVRAVFEPWNLEVPCPRSIYEGDTPDEIRVWGRRRLLLLERVIPVARSFTAFLLGSGMPSFFVADLGDMSFTLGLSGWTANDWSRLGNFDLMAPRADVGDLTKQAVFQALEENWRDDAPSLSRRLGLESNLVMGALAAYTQAGRVMFDLNKGVYRVRELSREPLPMEKLRFANPREAAAERFVEAGGVRMTAEATSDGVHLKGRVNDKGKELDVDMLIDVDERLARASCGCSFYIRNKLFRGPCEHMLALRAQHRTNYG